MQDDAPNPQGGLPVRLVDKPWGVKHLPAPFAAQEGRQIGEIWFEPPAALPQLLVKYIFTSDKLSVQVHPSDEQTIAKGLGKQGKEECWLVLATEPGAQLGIGFREPVDGETMRRAALDGSIEGMMVWHDVVPGDFFYIPANTVHAIGAGVTVMEVQQNSDITYRLYDYGRPRELHLDESIAVARGEVYDLARWHRHMGEGESARLVDGPYFLLDRVAGVPPRDVAARYGQGALLVAPLKSTVTVDGAVVAPGGCALATSLDAVCFADDGLVVLAQSVMG
ncbi:MAG: class I mannose-6-phosphate isomerase [Sphingomonadales bacterium]|nr:class I mannose-6-phosphate isomerase [Sphingomonadales bacterium]